VRLQLKELEAQQAVLEGELKAEREEQEKLTTLRCVPVEFLHVGEAVAGSNSFKAESRVQEKAQVAFHGVVGIICHPLFTPSYNPPTPTPHRNEVGAAFGG
jgi:hypothetical protein